MGRVKAHQAKGEAKEASIAKAIQAYKVGTYTRIRDAADSQGLAYSTLYCRLKGRQCRRKAHELDQNLEDIEEKKVVKQIEDMDRRGFPIRVDMVRQLATKILCDREHDTASPPTLGKKWVPRFLDRHPHLATKFSIQVHKQRIVASDPKILKHTFEVLGPIIQKFKIVPRNIYNMDEKGLQMGKSSRVKVVHVCTISKENIVLILV